MNECCADLTNRERQPVPPEQRELARRQTGATPGLTVCRVCNRRHFTLTIDTVTMGLHGQAMGA
jgi:hypothetical protein